MRSVPLQLPLKVNEASTLAELILQQAEGRRLNDDLRSRLGARMQSAQFASMTPFPGSLQRDPIHPSTYYVVIDTDGSQPETWLLRMALASSPSSGLFPDSLLIGRMRTKAGHEVVVNAIRFSRMDGTAIRTFVEQVDRAFVPRPQGTARTIAVEDEPLERVFKEYGGILRRTGANVAALVAKDQAAFDAALWAAIRAGWREGYTMETDVERVEDAPQGCTKFAIRVGERLDDVEAVYDAIRARVGRKVDFELVFPGAIGQEAEHLRSRGRPVQFVSSERIEPADVAAGVLRRSIAEGGKVSYRMSSLQALQNVKLGT